jgi:hypothetical protein
MDLEAFHDPELDAFVEETRKWNAQLPPETMPPAWTPQLIARARDLTQVMGGIFADAGIPGFAERAIRGPAGELRLRTFVPDEVRAVYLDVHGGGFFMGTPAMDDRWNAALARRARVATVSVDYRLAPEHRRPRGHAAGALQRRRGGPAARRQPLHGDALARGRQPRRARRLPGIAPRLRRLPDGDGARGQRAHRGLGQRARVGVTSSIG